jgi:hypothetical protein
MYLVGNKTSNWTNVPGTCIPLRSPIFPQNGKQETRYSLVVIIQSRSRRVKASLRGPWHSYALLGISAKVAVTHPTVRTNSRYEVGA